MNRIREILKEKGMTQEQLAELAGMAQANISRIINDKKPNLALTTAKRISKILGYPIEYIWPD